MKKIMLLALFVLLLCLLAFPAAAQEHGDAHCLCGGSCTSLDDHNCAAVNWKPLPAGTTDFGQLGSGHYYLTGNVTIKGASEIKNDLSICLNGYNITTTVHRAFGNTVACTLNITDCSYENGAWSGTVTGGTSIYGGIIYTYYRSTVNIYGGNFTGNGAYNTMGGLISVAQDGKDDAAKYDPAYKATLNIYNGNIYGGKSGKGGNLMVMHCSVINMYGGSIHDGQVVYSESTAQPGIGGNVFIDSSATFNLYGGKIYNGTALQGAKTIANAGSGGNIGLTGTFNMYGGEIWNGAAQHDPTTKSSGTAWDVATAGRGGNIYA